MIRKERFGLDLDTFAAERREILNRSDAQIRDAVRASLIRLGLPQWEDNAVTAALEIFDETITTESDENSQVIDDLRNEFERELRDALGKTKAQQNFNSHVETLTRWLSTYAVNAAVEAATTVDPDPNVGLEWVTMGDNDVRKTHVDVNGQTVPTGQPFTVAGEELLYPGQPVGDPSVWINCRCAARPALLESGFTAAADAPGLKKDGTPPVCKYCANPATGYVLHSEGMAFVPFCAEHEEQAKTDAAASTPGAEPDEGNIDRVATYAHEPTVGRPTVEEPVEVRGTEEPSVEDKKTTTSVIVALPAADDPITAASSEEDGAHVTLLFLGDSSEFDPADIMSSLAAYTTTFSGGPFEDTVASTPFMLGDGGAEVVLVDTENLANIRGAILADENVRARHDQVEQFPTWIPHITLGYTETPKLGDVAQGSAIRFDRLALWHGEEKTEYPLAGKVEVEESTPPPVDGEFSALVSTTAARPTEVFELAGVIGDVPPEELAEPAPVENDDAPPELDEADLYMPVPWHGLLAPEGTPSGDKRLFALNALTNRDLPVPLKRQREDAPGHDGSFPVGRIDKVWRDDQDRFWGEGVFDSNEDGYESIRLIADQIQDGLSVDVDAIEGEPGEDGQDVYTAARVAAVTICSVPAFAESKIFLGPAQEIEEEDVETIPVPELEEGAPAKDEFDIAPRKTKDGPGWITEPKPTQRITAYWVDGIGAAKINWGVPGDFNRCRLQLGKYVQNPQWLAGLCANLHYRALGVWPGREGGKSTVKNIVASAAIIEEVLPADYFRNPNLEGPTPFQIRGKHVFGHIATWDTCHIGVTKECVTAPHSATDYSFFTTGEVLTDAGPVAVGNITMGGGHADVRLNLRATLAHYDSTTTPVADVTVGEDVFGIWVAGALRDDLTPSDVRALRAAAISGDWRNVTQRGTTYRELCAALAVNVPGFPIPRTKIGMNGDTQVALVAAAIPLSAEQLAFEKAEEAKALRQGMRAFAASQIRHSVAGRR